MCSAHGEILCVSFGPNVLAITDMAISTAPVLRDVKITYSGHIFNGSFLGENIFRQSGSDEVDAAWEALGVDCKLTNKSRSVSLVLTASIFRSCRCHFRRRRPTKWIDGCACASVGEIRRRIYREC
jgi:hypothetical protein